MQGSKDCVIDMFEELLVPILKGEFFVVGWSIDMEHDSRISRTVEIRMKDGRTVELKA